VLRQACRAVQHWRATVPGHGQLGVAVNVSVHQVLSGWLYDDVVEALRDSGMAPSTLTLEIIESTAIEDSERVAAEFARLQAIGVRIAVDDFGAGYSSLGFLIGLDVDTLKIDRTILEFDATRRGSLVADRRARPDAGPDRGRGGRGDPGAPRLGAAGVLRRGAGLPLLPTAARRRRAAVPPGVRP